MSDQQIKELFGAMVAGAPADLLDLDRAIVVGRRRRRMRVSAAVASAVAVVAIMVGFAFGLPRTTSTPTPPPVGPTPTADPSPTGVTPASVTGSAYDWANAVIASLPYRDEVKELGAFPFTDPAKPPRSGDQLSRSSMVVASYSYTHGGRTTGLVVRASAKGAYGTSQGDPRDIMRALCAPSAPCTVRETAAGPVVITSGTEDMSFEGGAGGTARFVIATHLRPSGVLISVASYDGGVDPAGNPSNGDGIPGMDGDLDRLVATATTVPVPALEAEFVLPSATPWSPTPVATPSADSAVRVVTSGKPVDVGSGATATFTAGQACVTVRGASRSICAPAYRGGERDISKVAVVLGSGAGFVVVGKHPLGTADVASIVVTMGGISRLATLVDVGADDPHLSYYVVMPPSSSSRATVEVYDHQGRLTAQNLAG